MAEAVAPDAGEAVRAEGLPAAGNGGPTELALPGPGGGRAEIAHRGEAEPHAAWLGLDATGWVSLAMLVLLGIALWKGAFRGIGAALDGRIARVKADLAEAERLRTEAAALLADARAREAAAEGDAARMVETAREQARGILADAEREAGARVARRAAQAESRIAAAEREATADLRAQVARLAVAASRRVIAERADAELQAGLTNRAIDEVGRRLV